MEIPLTQTVPQARYRLLDPRTLDQDSRRYLADLLVSHLRDDEWELREEAGLEDAGIPRHPGERPAHRTIGKGFPTPRGTGYVLTFTAPPVYEIGIPKYLVVLEEVAYTFWSRQHERGDPPLLSLLDRLLHGLRGSARVFYPEPSGYGTAKRLKLRRSKHVTRDEGDAALSLLDACLVAVLVDPC